MSVALRVIHYTILPKKSGEGGLEPPTLESQSNALPVKLLPVVESDRIERSPFVLQTNVRTCYTMIPKV
jgi:hypothetical protein